MKLNLHKILNLLTIILFVSVILLNTNAHRSQNKVAAQPPQVDALFIGHSLINYSRYIYDQMHAFGIEGAINGHDVVCSGCSLLNSSVGPPHATNSDTQEYIEYFLDITSRSGPGAAAYMYDPGEYGPPTNNPPVIPDEFDYVIAVDHVNNYWNVSTTNGLVDSFEWIYDFARSYDADINLVVMLPWGFEPTPNINTFTQNTYFALEDLAALNKYFHVAPVGEVIRRVRADNVYNINYLEDTIHLNAAGEYIRAATFYATLTGAHPSALSAGDSGLSGAEKNFVDSTVWTVVHQCSFSLVDGPNSSNGSGECNESLPTPTPGGATPTPSNTPTVTPTPVTAQSVCQANGGIWKNVRQECWEIPESVCTNYNGVYDSCVSSCRNAPTNTACTQNCIQVCNFSNFQTSLMSAASISSKHLSHLVNEIVILLQPYLK